MDNGEHEEDNMAREYGTSEGFPNNENSTLHGTRPGLEPFPDHLSNAGHASLEKDLGVGCIILLVLRGTITEVIEARWSYTTA